MAAVFDAGEIQAVLQLDRDPFTMGLAVAKAEAQAFREWMSRPIDLNVNVDAQAIAEAVTASVKADLTGQAQVLEQAAELHAELEDLYGQFDVHPVLDAADVAAFERVLREMEAAAGKPVSWEEPTFLDYIPELESAGVAQFTSELAVLRDAVGKPGGFGEVTTLPYEVELSAASVASFLADLEAVGAAAGRPGLEDGEVVWGYAVELNAVGFYTGMEQMKIEAGKAAGWDVPTPLLYIADVVDAGGGGAGGGGSSWWRNIFGTGGEAGGGGFLANIFGAGGMGAFWTWVHALHLVMPEIIGFLSALGAVAIGLGVLGVASIGAATDIMTGFQAVSNAQNAIQAAIPGTTQWQAAVVSLGQAWSTIPTALQPAVQAINQLMQSFGNAPMAQEIAGFLSAQLEALSHFLSKSSGLFTPLILATQQAIDTVEGIFAQLAANGTLQRFVDGVAGMVGKSMVELAQLAIAVVQIASGFAHAISGGAGMEMLVSLFQNLAALVGTSFFQGFVAGWVSFDRILSTILGLFADLLGVIQTTSGGMQGLGIIVGFAVSALTTLKAVLFLLGIAGYEGAASLTVFGLSVSTLLVRASGLALIAIGVSGVVSAVTSLLHIGDPLTALWNLIGGGIRRGTLAFSGLISTVNGYKLQLESSIPVTGQVSAAMDVLVRSEQAIGSSLVSAATGFATFAPAAISSVSSIISNLTKQNTDLASWAADAQILIKRGMNPAAVAAMAQQAPQDLASMATATNAQLAQLAVQWNEKMMLAGMSGQQGAQELIKGITQGLASGEASVRSAAAQLAQTLNTSMGLGKFDIGTQMASSSAAALHSHDQALTVTQQSTDRLAYSMNAIPTKVIQTVAGQLHQVVVAEMKVVASTNSMASAMSKSHSSILSVLSSVSLMAIGILMLGEKMRLMTLLTEGWTVAQDLLDAAMDVNPIVLIGAAILSLIIIVVILVTHWKEVTKVAGEVWHTVAAYFASLWGDVTRSVSGMAADVAKWFQSIWKDVTKIVGSIISWVRSNWPEILVVLTGPFGLLVPFVSSHLSEILGFFKALPGNLVKALGNVGSILLNVGKDIINGMLTGIKSAWSTLTGWITSAVSGLSGVAKHILGIASPSTVFAAIGEAIPQGLQVGITAGMPGATSALTLGMSRLTQAGHASAGVALNSSTGGGSSGDTASLLAKLEEIRQEFGKLQSSTLRMVRSQ